MKNRMKIFVPFHQFLPKVEIEVSIYGCIYFGLEKSGSYLCKTQEKNIDQLI